MNSFTDRGCPRHIADGFTARGGDAQRKRIMGIVGLMYEADRLPSRTALKCRLVEGHPRNPEKHNIVIHRDSLPPVG